MNHMPSSNAEYLTICVGARVCVRVCRRQLVSPLENSVKTKRARRKVADVQSNRSLVWKTWYDARETHRSKKHARNERESISWDRKKYCLPGIRDSGKSCLERDTRVSDHTHTHWTREREHRKMIISGEKKWQRDDLAPKEDEYLRRAASTCKAK